MKKKVLLSWVAVAIVILFTSCKDKLEQAILEGYNNAFSEANSSESVRLSDDDFEDVCKWFKTYAEEQRNPDYNDMEWRWNYVKDILSGIYDESDIDRVDATQWIGQVAQLPLVIDVYLDNTSSMKGYISHKHVEDSTFVDVFHAIDDYLYRCGNQSFMTDSIRCFYTQRNKSTNRDEIVKLSWYDENDGMKAQLDHNRITKFTDSYKLNDFLDSISTRLEADKEHCHLAFFITDGIPSGPNEKVKPGGTWNIDRGHVVDQKNDIRTIAQRMATNGIGVSVYQFEGDFYGTDCYYWYHDNSKQPVTTPVKRPFYVIIMGDSTMVEHFLQQVENGLNLFRPQNQVHFFPNKENVQIQVCDSNDNNAEESGVDEYLFSNLSEDVLKVIVSAPLETLPSFISAENQLSRIIALEVDGKIISSSKIEKGKVVLGPISLEKNTRKKASITIYNESPSWAKEMNVKNDLKEGYSMGTFNFLVLIDGLREGFVGENNILFKKEISIKRDN